MSSELLPSYNTNTITPENGYYDLSVNSKLYWGGLICDQNNRNVVYFFHVIVNYM